MGMSIGEFIASRARTVTGPPARWSCEFRQAGYFPATLPVGEISKWQAAHQWCKQEIGVDHYSWTGNQFWFEREDHAVMFLLKWS